MVERKTVSFVFPRVLRGKTKLTCFLREQTLCALLYIWTFPSTIAAKHPRRAKTAGLYPGQDIFEVYHGHVTKNQPITVLILLSESLGI